MAEDEEGWQRRGRHWDVWEDEVARDHVAEDERPALGIAHPPVKGFGRGTERAAVAEDKPAAAAAKGLAKLVNRGVVNDLEEFYAVVRGVVLLELRAERRTACV